MHGHESHVFVHPGVGTLPPAPPRPHLQAHAKSQDPSATRKGEVLTSGEFCTFPLPSGYPLSWGPC